MSKVKIIKIYRKEDAPKNLDFEFDQKHPEKPHWILIKGIDKRPRFLSVCTHKNSELIYKAFGNFYYPIDHIPSQGIQNSLMKAVANRYDDIVGELNVEIAEFLYKEVLKLNLSKNTRILDLGAGTGLTSTPFIKNGYRNITMVDISEEMKKVALRKKIFKDVDYFNQDVRNLDVPEKFDLVISGMFLCDLDDSGRKKMFRRLSKHLSEESYIALVEDEEREIYHKHFEPISSGKAPFGEYTKYFFVGKHRR